ncbi:claudin-4-like [Poecilia formosa]|uniref:claudin-4-like n=1 Tax=Poecilia formosa TaxID=48698 RepID=UPI0007BA86B4|nr:PREDICTED: claudin-4-like [Poecilia formosa]
MRPSAVQMVCLAFGAVGLIGAIRCCTLPQWVVWVYRSENRTSKEHQRGLWMDCEKQSTRQLECKLHDSMVAPPPLLQAFRAMTVISCILCGLSLLILFFGADFTTCVQNQDTKHRTILVAKVGLLLAGLLVIIPVSWVAHTPYALMVRDTPLLNVLKRELGVCIYIGWAAGVLMILTGVLLCCLSRPRSSCSGGTTSYYSNRASAANNDVI